MWSTAEHFGRTCKWRNASDLAMWTWSIIDKAGRTDSSEVTNSEKHDFKVKKKKKSFKNHQGENWTLIIGCDGCISLPR